MMKSTAFVRVQPHEQKTLVPIRYLRFLNEHLKSIKCDIIQFEPLVKA